MKLLIFFLDYITWISENGLSGYTATDGEAFCKYISLFGSLFKTIYSPFSFYFIVYL